MTDEVTKEGNVESQFVEQRSKFSYLLNGATVEVSDLMWSKTSGDMSSSSEFAEVTYVQDGDHGFDAIVKNLKGEKLEFDSYFSVIDGTWYVLAKVPDSGPRLLADEP